MDNNLYAVLVKIAEGDKINFAKGTGGGEYIDDTPKVPPGDNEDLKNFLQKNFPTPEEMLQEHIPEQLQDTTEMEQPQKKRPAKYTVFVKKILKIVDEERSAHFEFLSSFDESLNNEVLLFFLKFCPCAAKKLKKLALNDNIVVFDRHAPCEKNGKALKLIMKYILKMQPPPSWSNAFPSTEKVMFFLYAVPMKKASVWNKITKKTSKILCTRGAPKGGKSKPKRDYYVSKKRITIGDDSVISSNTPEGAYRKIVVFLYDDKFTKKMAKANKTFLRLSKIEKLFVWHFNPVKGKYQHFFLVNVQEKSPKGPEKKNTDTFLMMLTMAIFMTVMFFAVLH